MAGPCSVESEKQIMQAAEGVAKAGGKCCAAGRVQAPDFAIRFSGDGKKKDLKLLQKAKQTTGLEIVTEVMSEPRRRLGGEVC